MATTPRARRLGRVELTFLLAMSMALGALGIDVLLPAFPALRETLGLPPNSTVVAGVVTTYLLGLAVGQLIYGPLADRYGRRPVMLVGFAVYFLGAVWSALSGSLAMLLVARFVWGFGGAGPRVLSVAVIRDSYEGERMARVMSFVMAVFIMVPVVAPTLGAALLDIGGWRGLFVACALIGVALAVWAGIRLPETLRPEMRLELSPAALKRTFRTVVTNRVTVGYTLSLTMMLGAFISWIASSEIIIAEVFGLRDWFPIVFGGLAAVLGVGMLANGVAVGRFGIRRVVRAVFAGYIAATVALGVLAAATGGHPPFWAFATVLAATLWCHALLIPNLNTLAMAPMGAVAGTASSVIGAVSTAGASIIGAVIDNLFDESVLPLSIAFVVCGLAALALARWTEPAPGGSIRPRTAEVRSELGA